jgi:hypothetical protein
LACSTPRHAYQALSALPSATATADNTGMKWKSPAADPVVRDWGRGPSLVQGVPAPLTLPAPVARVRARALDERGQHGEAVPVRDAGQGGARHRPGTADAVVRGRGEVSQRDPTSRPGAAASSAARHVKCAALAGR